MDKPLSVEHTTTLLSETLQSSSSTFTYIHLTPTSPTPFSMTSSLWPVKGTIPKKHHFIDSST
ncbi:hypothetical protein AALO_G00122200 [Alosa alosa]|uniref:Uncharacterized protein n=1 Tax=Alosa alosa TaxID=278164 RepID=A0AAV6GK84_9TELE|nr:hypothetical protein AALO_G00122200 [Alosa alosa]